MKVKVEVEPWFVGAQNDGLFIINRKASPAGTDVVWEGRKDVKVIAIVEDRDTFDETSTNANLLAAAPELYKVAQKALERLANGGSENHSDLQRELRAAIQKAENE